jgi:hypothetical protein
MVLSLREKKIAIAAGAALLLLALDQWVLAPVISLRQQSASRVQALQKQVSKQQSLVEKSRQAAPRWDEMLAAGLKTDPAETESLGMHTLRDRAEECGVALTLLKPERMTPADKKARMAEIVVQAEGTGKMESVVRLLYRLQNATAPVKVTELHINSRKEGQDDLAFQLKLSTVYLVKARAARGAASEAASRPAGSK